MMNAHQYGNQSAPNVMIPMVDGHDLGFVEREAQMLADSAGEEFWLLALKTDDWNKDLSPWSAPAVFGKDDFGEGATETLSEIQRLTTDAGKKYYLGGYSLAGLFALWAAYRTDRFAGVAAASLSVWFPGFVDYMKKRESRTGNVYLSLGDQEERTKNLVMATVGDRIREQVNAERLLHAPGHKFKGKSDDAEALAVDPSLELSYIVVVHRMAYYMDYSSRIVSIYLKYVSMEDIHIYSIDEVFIDATRYLRGRNAREFAEMLIRDVLSTTGITATAGIGTNL